MKKLLSIILTLSFILCASASLAVSADPVRLHDAAIGWTTTGGGHPYITTDPDRGLLMIATSTQYFLTYEHWMNHNLLESLYNGGTITTTMSPKGNWAVFFGARGLSTALNARSCWYSEGTTMSWVAIEVLANGAAALRFYYDNTTEETTDRNQHLVETVLLNTTPELKEKYNMDGVSDIELKVEFSKEGNVVAYVNGVKALEKAGYPTNGSQLGTMTYGTFTEASAEVTYIKSFDVDSTVPEFGLIGDDSGYTGDNLTWNFDEATGTLTISGSGDMYNYDPNHEEYSPWYNYNNLIKTVNISNGVTSIGDSAFYECNSLTSITIPDSVTTIDEGAFRHCNNLKTIYISSHQIVQKLTNGEGAGALIKCADIVYIKSTIASVPSYISTNYPYTSTVTEDGVTYTAYTKSKCTFGHDYSEEWTTSYYSHYHKCKNCTAYTDSASHIYDNSCDTSCNTCGYIRAITHSYKTAWSNDASKHWHECYVCRVKKDEATHTFDNACDTECNTCGYIRAITHSYEEEWSSNRNQHWYECAVCGDKKDEANHVPGAPATEYTAQICTVCQYVIESALGHTHRYSDDWTFNRDMHWHACAGCSDKKDSGDHVYDNTCDTECNTCGYIRTITHTYKTVWSKDDNKHWHECSVCHAKKDEASHSYDNACDTSCNTCGQSRVTTHRYDNTCDGSCNICGDTRTITHNYKNTWSKSKNKHWHECSICGHVKDEASHVAGAPATETTDQTCTVCGYVIKAAVGHTHSYGSEWLKDSENHWKECNCGEKSQLSAHTWNEGEITHEPSFEAEGEKTFTCTVCSATKTEKLEKLDPPPVDDPDDPENPDNGNDTPENPDDGNDTPDDPDDGNDTPENPDNGNDTPDDEQGSGDTDKSDAPKDEGEDYKTVIIIVSIVAAVSLLGCTAMATTMVIVLKKRK